MKNNLYLIGIVLVIAFATYQVFDYLMFRNKGARFTAHDGQALCERIQKLDGLPCRYGK